MVKNLLLVDDEEMILELLTRILKNKVDNIYTACDGCIALDVLKNNDITCIISDIQMPQKNGMEFLKSARNNGFHTPFIFFTSFSDTELLEEALKYDAFDFLEKPNFEQVQQVIEFGFKENFNILNTNNTQIVSEYRKMLISKS